MLLELAQAVTFFASIVSLYWLGISAFFVPGTRWQDRLLLALPRLAVFGCSSFLSGLLFRWPARSNPTARQPLTRTLPVRLFFWAAAGVAILFLLSQYLVCGGEIFSGRISHNCS